LRPKTRHAALLAAHLEQPNFAPRVLPGVFWGSNAGMIYSQTGSKEKDTGDQYQLETAFTDPRL